MWDWKPGDEIRAHRYAMKHAKQEEYDEFLRIVDPEFDAWPNEAIAASDLVDIFRKSFAA